MTNYAIRITRHYYSPKQDTTNFLRDYDDDVVVFETHRAARLWIKNTDSRIYRTEHNESGRPSYRIYSTDTPRIADKLASARS